MDAAQQIIAKFSTEVLNPAILVIFSAGFLMFIWGLVEFLRSLSGGGSGMDDGKRHMLWGTIGMFIMISFFAIISVISNTFGLGINPRNPGAYNPDTSRLDSINFKFH